MLLFIQNLIFVCDLVVLAVFGRQRFQLILNKGRKTTVVQANEQLVVYIQRNSIKFQIPDLFDTFDLRGIFRRLQTNISKEQISKIVIEERRPQMATHNIIAGEITGKRITNLANHLANGHSLIIFIEIPIVIFDECGNTVKLLCYNIMIAFNRTSIGTGTICARFP